MSALDRLSRFKPQLLSFHLCDLGHVMLCTTAPPPRARDGDRERASSEHALRPVRYRHQLYLAQAALGPTQRL